MTEPFYDRQGITIYHGDCQSVLPQLATASVHFVLTDPPYLVGYRGRWDSPNEQIVGDTDPSWVEPVYRELWRVLKPDSFCVSFYGWPHTDTFLGLWKAIGFRPVSHLAFVKRQWGLGRFTRGTHETAYLLAKGSPPIPKSAISDVIDWQREDVSFHPNQKPVSALAPLILTYCPDGGIVLDPFMGSGSTLRAAKDLGMSAIGIEIEQRYCQKAVARMAQDVIAFP